VPRFKLTIEYDGAPYVGWQRQANGRGVQQVVETALGAVSGGPVLIQGAGRTDAGVHATGQVAHCDLDKAWRPDKLREALNAHLKFTAVAVTEIEAVADDFEARFSARQRRYTYRILNRRAQPTLLAGRVWHIKRSLDTASMNEAAQRLLGHHDFTTFRASECQANSPMRTLDALEVVRTGDIVEVHAGARSFLHNQVRSMVGSLTYVGSGRWTPDDLAAALAAKDRTRCGVVAPAAGLYLVGVVYG
jgi:tRNA pseudouridine38-40 synthase